MGVDEGYVVLSVCRSILVLVVLAGAGCTADAPAATTTTTTGTPSTVRDSVTDSTAPVLEVADPQPPSLLVVLDNSQLAVSGFDYCWQEPGSGQEVCGDSFGTEVPTRVEVDSAEVTVQWVSEGVLTAGIHDGEYSCQPPLAIAEDGEGIWRMAVPELPGTYRVDLYGIAPQGSTRFALEVTTSVAGPAAAPRATIWWPDTADQFEPSVSMLGAGSALEARLLIVSSDNSSTEYVLEAVFPMDYVVGDGEAPPIRCDATFLIRHEDEPVTFEFNESVLGRPPYEVTLTVGDKGPEFARSWLWPDELDEDESLTGSMHPTSGEPWHPEENSDPLIDSSS